MVATRSVTRAEEETNVIKSPTKPSPRSKIRERNKKANNEVETGGIKVSKITSLDDKKIELDFQKNSESEIGNSDSQGELKSEFGLTHSQDSNSNYQEKELAAFPDKKSTIKAIKSEYEGLEGAKTISDSESSSSASFSELDDSLDSDLSDEEVNDLINNASDLYLSALNSLKSSGKISNSKNVKSNVRKSKNKKSLNTVKNEGKEQESEVVSQLPLFAIDTKPGFDHTLSFEKNKSSTTSQKQDCLEKGKTFKKLAHDNFNKKKKELHEKISKLAKPVSQLNPGMEMHSYINANSFEKPVSKVKELEKLKSKGNSLMKQSVITADFEKKHAIPPYSEGVRQQKRERKKQRDSTKGKKWFDMRAPEMTEELKNDLTVLKMRKALDPKRFYKNNDSVGLPKYFEMGTVVENSADFYTGRVPKKQRKQTIVEELLADADFRKFNKRKYSEIAQKEQSKKLRKAHKHMKRLKKK